MKKIIAIALIFVVVFNLCSCGTGSGQDTETVADKAVFSETDIALDSKGEKGNLPIKVADAYECIKTDTPIKDSGLIYVESANDILHVFIGQRTDEGKTFFEYCAYDMLEEEWSEPKKCTWNENLFKIVDYAQAFHIGQDGN